LVGLVIFTICDLLILQILKTDPILKSRRPVNLGAPLHALDVLQVQARSALNAVLVLLEERKRVDALFLRLLRAAAGHLTVCTPVEVFRVILLSQVLARRRVVMQINRPQLERRRRMLTEQPRTATRRLPQFEDTGFHRVRISVRFDDPEFMGMQVPTVIAVGNFERPNQPLVSKLGSKPLGKGIAGAHQA